MVEEIWCRDLFFEALPLIYKILSENTKLNNASVDAFNLSIGEENLASGHMPASGNILQMAYSSQGENNILTTKVDSLNFPGPEIIKIDVE